MNKVYDREFFKNEFEAYPGKDIDTDEILLLLDNNRNTLEKLMKIVEDTWDDIEKAIEVVECYVRNIAIHDMGDVGESLFLISALADMEKYYHDNYPGIANEGIKAYWILVTVTYRQKYDELRKYKEENG